MGFIHEHGGWFIYPLIIIGIIWFWRGGTEYESSHEPYIKPLAPLNTGETYGNIYLSKDKTKQQLDLPENPITSIRKFFSRLSGESVTDQGIIPLSKAFFIDGIAGADATNPQEEYVRIIASKENKSPSLLSGFILTGSGYSIKVTLPRAVETFTLGSTTAATDIYVPAQGRVIISSGKSPVGASFRVNSCTGYLGQFQTFVPNLRADCPRPADELKKYGPYEDVSCRSFVEKLPACRSFNGTFPVGASTECKKFVIEKLSYNACLVGHSKDADFHKNEWRLFLGKTEELWKNKQEVIRLYDSKGIIIDGITY